MGGDFFILPVDSCVYCVYTVYTAYEQFRLQGGTRHGAVYLQFRPGTHLRAGDALPSIRLLAKELRISVITTKRAYEDLEADGFITTMPGRGSFVAPQNPALHREESLKQMEEHLQHAIDAARRGGITKDEVRETLDLLWEES